MLEIKQILKLRSPFAESLKFICWRTLQALTSRRNQTEERISVPGDWLSENTVGGKKKKRTERKEDRQQDLQKELKRPNLRIVGVQEGVEGGHVAHVCNPSTLGGGGRGLLEARSSRPAWTTYQDLVSTKIFFFLFSWTQ